MDNNKVEIGRRIRAFRLKNNLTQAQLAEVLDVSTNFISEVETGKKNISLDTLCRLCEHYQLSADYLLLGKESSADSPLIERLTSLPTQDVLTVIQYLEIYLKMKKIEKKFPDGNDRKNTPE